MGSKKGPSFCDDRIVGCQKLKN